MILDALLRVANSQTFNGAAEVSASSVDLASFVPSAPSTPLTPARRVGTGEALAAVFCVETAAAATGAGTEIFGLQVVGDIEDDLATSVLRVVAQIHRTEAELAAGTIHVCDIPVGEIKERYLGVQVDLPLSSSTVTMSVYIGPRSMVDAWFAYAKNYSV